MISDAELLAACRAAGEPGTESHRAACRLYRAAAAEWRERDLAWRQEHADRAAERDGCGTPRAYRRHNRRGERACSRCLAAWAAYGRELKAARDRKRTAAAAAATRKERAVQALRESPAFAAHLAGELVLG